MSPVTPSLVAFNSIPIGLLLLGSLTLPAVGFGTINEPVVLGQHNEHEMVTRLAFQCPTGQKSDGICFEPRSLDQLAGYHLDVMGLALPGAGFNGAVGAPDTLDPIPEGPEAHCDNADFVDIPGYPQSRENATANLQVCVDHLRARFRQAWVSAEGLVDEKNRIRMGTVELVSAFGGDCRFAFPSLQINTLARPKCSTLEGFGRALHGVQDFYSHSNWADWTDHSKPISAGNPPGLALNTTAAFLDLRASGPIPPDQIPHNLTTGCFAIPDATPGSGECAGRVTHHALNKDHGVINLDGTFGEVGVFSLRASVIPENFHNAVHAAVQASREAWESFREELRYRYGKTVGNLMICALVRDDPIKDCRTRTVTVAIDRSQLSIDHGTMELEGELAKELNSRLTRHGLDRIEIIDFADSPRVVFPMGYPESTVIAESRLTSSGRANVGLALELAINDTIAAQPETYTDRAAIVVLTPGVGMAANDLDGASVLAQVNRAYQEGIRIHYTCINPSWDECVPGTGADSQDRTLMPTTVLKTGGTFVLLDSTSQSPHITHDLINTITHRGLAWTDEYLPDRDTTQLYPGISLAVLLSPEDDAADPTGPPKSIKTFFYPASTGEILNLTIQDRTQQGHGGCFSITLLDDKQDNIKLLSYKSCETEPLQPMVLAYEATRDVDLRVVAELLEEDGKECGETEHHYAHFGGTNPVPPDNEMAQIIIDEVNETQVQAVEVVEDTNTSSSSSGAGNTNESEMEVIFTIELTTNMPEKDDSERRRTAETTEGDLAGKEESGTTTGTVVLVTTETETAGGSISGHATSTLSPVHGEEDAGSSDHDEL
ncbi:hypothetical protein V8F20_002665 [Naviculisporaceae sp. PSN 640]